MLRRVPPRCPNWWEWHGPVAASFRCLAQVPEWSTPWCQISAAVTGGWWLFAAGILTTAGAHRVRPDRNRCIALLLRVRLPARLPETACTALRGDPVRLWHLAGTKQRAHLSHGREQALLECR